uniref:DUF218 domain-containing protein n=1 Tax=Marseillevirus LCMAC201 TaxID=2506605 RepID=A0A481YW40_9VIRU|nr:MAG: protein of unknown function DUF218 [Marseillevirus LCMAC201]
MIEIIIILGNRNIPILKERVVRALEYFYLSPAEITSDFFPEPQIVKYILFSGGASDGKSKPEGAVMMEKYCTGKIDPKFCLLETTSRNTAENLINSKQLIEKMFPSNFTQPKITICTSTFHIKRSMILTELIFRNYTTNFVHTHEQINHTEYQREAQLLNTFLDQYTNEHTEH